MLQRPGVNLASLAELLQAAEPTLQQIVGQRVIVLLGPTGVGESTLVNKLAGRGFIKERYSCMGDESKGHKWVFVPDVHLADFEIGHEARSKTKCIKHFETKCEDGKPVIYLDSSGFEDSTGVEVDISTSLSFAKVAQFCAQLRFVVLINCASFLESRAGGVWRLVSLVSSFVDDFEAYKQSFTFVFSHTDCIGEGKPLREVRTLLLGHLKDIQIGTTESLHVKGIIKWIMQCLKKDFPFVQVFHPEESERSDLNNTHHGCGQSGRCPSSWTEGG